MRDFTTTGHCLSRAHCNACRNNAALRAGMAKSFVMPDKCPWPDGQTWTLPPEAAGLCGKCMRKGCPNVTACCGGKTELHLRAPCPDGLWQMTTGA